MDMPYKTDFLKVRQMSVLGVD